jgi:hypothetical protein
MEEKTDKITNAYLMWVGSDSYKTIDVYVAEAAKQGVSKRLPNANVARKLMKPGVAIFIAHDEGETEACAECTGEIENPALRIALNQIQIQHRRIQSLYAERAGALEKANEEERDAVQKRHDKLVDNAIAKEEKMTTEAQDIPTTVEGTTGGTIVVDGAKWDYRRYNYWLHQPKKWNKADHTIAEKCMCEACGGTGRIPLGKVFGMMLPSAVEYVMRPEDTLEYKREMEAKGFRVVPANRVATEIARGCGRRKHGGVYAVTDDDAKRDTAEVAKKLIEKGVITGEVDFNGDFVRFVSPVDIPGVKRFRGIKSWSLDVDAEEEATMIMEAS